MDRTTPPAPLTDDELHALVDSQMDAVSQAALEWRLAQDPSAQATVAQWCRQRDLLRSLHTSVMDEPAPSGLMAAAQQTAAKRRLIDNRWRWAGIAAGVMMAFGAGWLSHGEWSGYQPQPARLAQATGGTEFVRQAGFAHVVYAPEVRHPVEVAAAEQAHLVQWLSKRVGKALKIPNLASQGYELVGGRLLPGEGGARAQFMFQQASGNRITLYLGAIESKTAAQSRADTAFRFSTETSVPSFYWVDQGFGYALSGQVPRDTLMKLAEAVYNQL